METIIAAVDWDNMEPVAIGNFVTHLIVKHKVAIDPVSRLRAAAEEFAKTRECRDELEKIGSDILWWSYADIIPKEILNRHKIESIRFPEIWEANDTYGLAYVDMEEE